MLIFWIAIGWIGFGVAPWYGVEDFWTFEWLIDGWPLDTDYAPALSLLAQGEKLWLAPLAPLLLGPLLALGRPKSDPVFARALLLCGGAGLAWLVVQGLGIGIRGYSMPWLTAAFGPLGDRQYGMGYGGALTAAAFLFFFTTGLAARGAVRGDVFVAGAIGAVIALVAIFVFFPLTRMLQAAFIGEDGGYSAGVFVEKFASPRIWGLGCVLGGGRCGAAWNSLLLGVLVGALTTALGLAFALALTRSNFRYKRILRAITVLPIITPPFVIGLALILLFGLSGTVTTFVADLLGVSASRWIYGLPGVLIAQVLAFTPIAFLVLIGVVEGVSPSMEEAAQTLRASRWQTFRTVSLPLMRPGLANAFLLGFVESMADFGNPLVLGGNFDVLSTEIFFAIVGAQYDQARAAALAIVLLGFTLTAFYAQRAWLGKKSYTTVTGKGDAGVHPAMPRRLAWPVFAIVAAWSAFTLVVYGMILYGSVVELWGVNNTLTFKHYITAFAIETQNGLHFTGAAWDSFWTTILIAALAAPFTAAIGLITAWLLTRQSFAGKNAFEFTTMLSFAIPGTVIGLSYVMAFNLPPIEITGTGLILIISFIFRNMPVGVRAGVASMTQLDKSLDESSLTLGANSWRTFRYVVLPLLRPAILAALVYSFVRAMTAISAVIFLVSARYDMATSYIIGRVENNDYGLAIAYSTALIFVMLAAVGLLQLLVGRTQIGRRHSHAGGH